MRPTLLIVDDNIGDRELVRQTLHEIGSDVEILEVTDGDDALVLLEALAREKQRLPDVILLDLNLVRLSGHQVLHRIKADSALHHIPVAVYTSSQDEADISRSYQLGAACVLTKPLTFAEAEALFRNFALFWLSTVTFDPRNRP
jgi:chemotaxis family two-component system response regulator Rcp1